MEGRELVTCYLKNNCTYKLWIRDKKGKTFELTQQGVSLKPHPAYMGCYALSIKLDKTYFKNALFIADVKDIAKAVPTIVEENGLKEIKGLKITNISISEHENFTYLIGIGSKII